MVKIKYRNRCTHKCPSQDILREQLNCINSKYSAMNQTLNNFIKILISVDDEIKFFRNLVNFGPREITWEDYENI